MRPMSQRFIIASGIKQAAMQQLLTGETRLPEFQGEWIRNSSKASVKASVKLLELLRQSPQMTLAEAAVHLGRSVRAVEMAGVKLVKAGKLRYVGAPKDGFGRY